MGGDSSTGYYEQIAPGYDALYKDPISLAENRIVAAHIRDLIQGRLVRNVMDIGCGTGLVYGMHAPENPALEHYVGLDICEEMLEQFRKKHGKDGRIRLAQADVNQGVEKFFPEGGIDLLVSTFGSFSYVDRPEETLKEIAKGLRPKNGHVVLMVYSRFSIRNILARTATENRIFLEKRRPYSFRNDGSGCAEGPKALFHTAESFKSQADAVGLRRVRVSGMNAFLESDRRIFSSVEEAEEALRGEMKEVPPDLAHSLILTATNYD